MPAFDRVLIRRALHDVLRLGIGNPGWTWPTWRRCCARAWPAQRWTTGWPHFDISVAVRHQAMSPTPGPRPSCCSGCGRWRSARALGGAAATAFASGTNASWCAAMSHLVLLLLCTLGLMGALEAFPGRRQPAADGGQPAGGRRHRRLGAAPLPVPPDARRGDRQPGHLPRLPGLCPLAGGRHGPGGGRRRRRGHAAGLLPRLRHRGHDLVGRQHPTLEARSAHQRQRLLVDVGQHQRHALALQACGAAAPARRCPRCPSRSGGASPAPPRACRPAAGPAAPRSCPPRRRTASRTARTPARRRQVGARQRLARGTACSCGR
jgi:hypothetical protein